MSFLKQKKYYITILIVLIAIIFLNGSYFKIVNIQGKVFIAKVALSKQEQIRGLGGRKNICSHCAMLFKFSQAGHYDFWMKEMQFNLDIIWINNGRIVYLVKNVSKNSIKIIKPPVLAQEVLEIKAENSSQYNFKIGDEVKIW